MKKSLKPISLFLLLILLSGLYLVLINGHTWHLFPAYLAMFISLLLLIRPTGKYRTIVSVFGLLALFTLSFLLLHYLPILSLPQPSGPFEVGVIYKNFQTDRNESMTPVLGDQRKLYLKIWYPAEKGIRKARFIDGGNATINQILNNSNLSVPKFIFKHLAKARTNGFLYTQIADGTFPLITFSHGHSMWQSQNTSLMEEMASRGIIAVSIAHSHQTIFAAASNDSIVTFDKMVSLVTDDKIDTIRLERYERITNDPKSKLEFDKVIIENIQLDSAANDFVKIWSTDITNTIDVMLDENRSIRSEFYNKIDTNRIGSSGMSFGGAAAVESTLSNTRIKAALNMDGMQFGNLINDMTDAKILFLGTKEYAHNYSNFGPFLERSSDQAECLMFIGAKHTNFSDISLISPLLIKIGMLGNINGEFMVTQMNQIAADFFETAFTGKSFNSSQYEIPGKIKIPDN